MKDTSRILIIDDEESIGLGFGAFLRAKGYQVVHAKNGSQGLSIFRTDSPDLVLLDMRLPDIDGIDLLRELKSENEFVVVIMVTAHGTIEKAVKALKLGADNFLTKPLDSESLLIMIEHALGIHNLRKQEVLNRMAKQSQDARFFTGRSTRMMKIIELATIIASDPLATVLIQGETGTGKGVWARWIHQHSNRSDKSFVEVNCAGLSKELLESELFGYEKGAFTGAVANKVGLLEIAGGGTLFLDEISEMEQAVQAKVLKVLEEKRFRRLGSVQERHSDVRLIAATNRSLEKQVEDGHFREDLFYRLNVLPLELPPLRERREDIIPLAEFLLVQMASQKSLPIPQISMDAQETLKNYNWPGNLREMKNVLERAFILRNGNVIDTGLLAIQPKFSIDSCDSAAPLVPLREIELKHIRGVLERVNNNYKKAAEILGVNRNTLYNRLKEK